jgi:hypothetical protein
MYTPLPISLSYPSELLYETNKQKSFESSMFADWNAFQLLPFTESEQSQFLPNLEQQNAKKAKAKTTKNLKRRVHFQELVVDTMFHYQQLPLHEESSGLWYDRHEFKAIHDEIFASLMEIKCGNLSNFEFSDRGLEEIRKRKPHKRHVRRKEYLANVVALSREQRRAFGGDGHPEELKEFAVAQSRSATLRAQHYAALDADEARLIYQESFQPRGPPKNESTGLRRVAYPHSPALSTTSVDSIARSA